MIKNNLEIDVKVKCLEEGVTQAQPGEDGRHLRTVCQQADQQERGHHQ